MSLDVSRIKVRGPAGMLAVVPYLLGHTTPRRWSPHRLARQVAQRAV